MVYIKKREEKDLFGKGEKCEKTKNKYKNMHFDCFTLELRPICGTIFIA